MQQSQQVNSNSRFNNTQVIFGGARSPCGNAKEPTKERRQKAREQRLNHRSSLKSLEAEVLKVPMQNISQQIRGELPSEDLNELLLNKQANSTIYLRSQKQLLLKNRDVS